MPLPTRLRSRPACEPSHEGRFLRNWLRNPLKTGAVFPSSRALAEAMARPVPLDGEGVVVELGPGTGVMTQALLDRGIAPERLVLIEYSPDFCTLLAARFPGVRIVQGDAYEPGGSFDDALAGRPIDAVVSSLPLMARPDAAREAALDHHLSRMAPRAPFIQFTYAPTLPVRPERVGARVEIGPYVKRNLPPARVLVYRREGGPAPTSRASSTAFA